MSAALSGAVDELTTFVTRLPARVVGDGVLLSRAEWGTLMALVARAHLFNAAATEPRSGDA